MVAFTTDVSYDNLADSISSCPTTFDDDTYFHSDFQNHGDVQEPSGETTGSSVARSFGVPGTSKSSDNSPQNDDPMLPSTSHQADLSTPVVAPRGDNGGDSLAQSLDVGDHNSVFVSIFRILNTSGTLILKALALQPSSAYLIRGGLA